uniref:Uncharacterized protein n=1 Tax=Hyaloperonospora arabidopsidis (strain Emoy2) TaxID=559515 RepID=M4B492_HYAAE
MRPEQYQLSPVIRPVPSSVDTTNVDISGSQLALVSTAWDTDALPVAQKRAHSTTLVEGEQIRQIMRTRLAVSAQDGEDFMRDEAQSTFSTDLVGTGASWQELWLKHGESWPASATVALPHVHSSTTDWIEVAKREPRGLLSMVQSFPYPEKILSVLDDQVFETWTAAWRRSCVQTRLLSFRARTSHPSTRQWLDTWITKLPGRPRTIYLRSRTAAMTGCVSEPRLTGKTRF